MPNVTLSIPEALHEKMKKHSEIRWSEVVRKTISEKIEDLELMEKLSKRSKLTQADVDEIAHKINRDVFKELNKR
ncbi:hypothetical protein HYX02_01770 [Candidatus Woesearchaeota archaeon]|nr:hypothetical protein [Candidatus Woesearchaeota archaeon]